MASEDRWNESQRFLIDRVLWAYVKAQQWPVYQWVEADLWSKGMNALEVIQSLPQLGGPWSRGRRYGDVRVPYGGVPRPEEKVSLTVRALAVLPLGQQMAEVFVTTLRQAAETRAAAMFDPTQVVTVELTSEAVLNGPAGRINPNYIPDIYELFTNEPLDGILSSGVTPEGAWRCGLGPEVTRYTDVTVDSYLAMIESELATPPEQPRARVVSNPLDIANALTYLDTTWRLHSTRSLLAVDDLAALTSLAYPVASGDEFTARCSALGDILKSFQAPSAPGVDGHALRRFRAYLEAELASDDLVGLEQAVTTLDLVRRARNARTHAAALADGQVALAHLGVPGPPFDWPSAWETIQSATADALMDLRLIVARLPQR